MFVKQRMMIIRCPVDAYSGYGLLSCEVAVFLQEQGIDIGLRPFFIREDYADIPDTVRSMIVPEAKIDGPELVIGPPDRVNVSGSPSAILTMWESSRIKPEWASNLNAASIVIVPSVWNFDGFRASGVTTKLTKCPLGIRLENFPYSMHSLTGPCVFGAVANLEGGGVRKNVQLLIASFIAEFNQDENVELDLKLMHVGDNLPEPIDPRIKIRHEFFDTRSLAEWYSRLTAFVSISSGEGWSLVTQEAMAVGRPVVAPDFGGLREYFTPTLGFAVNFDERTASGPYKGCGDWAEIDAASLRSKLRDVYLNRSKCVELGRRSATAASLFPIERTLKQLLAILRSNEIV